MLSLTGKLLKKGKLIEVQSKRGELYKKEFIIEMPGKEFTSHAAFECFGEKNNIVDRFEEGDWITVSFYVRSRMSTTTGTERWFTSLVAQSVIPFTDNVKETRNELPYERNQELPSNEVDLPF